MKILSSLLVLAVMVAAVTALPDKTHGADPDPVLRAELEASFREATQTLYDLLLPNTMARTKPRSVQEEQNLLNSFERNAAVFKRHTDISIPFLAAKVASTPPDVEEHAICALQLLYETDTESSREVIREAENHPNEIVSRLAKDMINENHDALWGFRNKKRDGGHNK